MSYSVDDLQHDLHEGAIDGDDVVRTLWGYDGPHTPNTIIAAGYALSALVRYANNATFPPDRLRYAPQLYRATGGLAGAAGGLPQLLRQLATRCGELAEHDHTMRHDGHGHGEASGRAAKNAAREAQAAYQDALVAANQLHDHLRRAHAELSHLGHDLPDTELAGDADRDA